MTNFKKKNFTKTYRYAEINQHYFNCEFASDDWKIVLLKTSFPENRKFSVRLDKFLDLEQ